MSLFVWIGLQVLLANLHWLSGTLDHELGHAWKITLSIVRNASLVVGREENESRVATNVNILGEVVGSGIDLTDLHVLNALESLSELFPNGSKLLAMSAPGSIKLNEVILGGIIDLRLEVLADKSIERTLLVFGNRLRLEIGLVLVLEGSLDEGNTSLGVEAILFSILIEDSHDR
jgi:hypothetical protein